MGSYMGVGVGLILYYMWLQPLFCTSGHTPRDQFVRATLIQIPLTLFFPLTARMVPNFGTMAVWAVVLLALTVKRVCAALSTEALLTMLQMLPHEKNLISRRFPIIAPMVVLFGWMLGMLVGSQLFAYSLASEGWGPKGHLLYTACSLASFLAAFIVPCLFPGVEEGPKRRGGMRDRSS